MSGGALVRAMRGQIWLLLSLLPAIGHAAPFVAFSPGHEAEILTLFEPFQPEQRVGEATFTGVQVGSNTIAAQVTAAGGAVGRLVLSARTGEPQQQANPLAPSASFDLALQPPELDARLVQPLTQLAERVRLHDPGGLVQRWTRAVAAPGTAPAPAEPRTAARAWLVAAGGLWMAVLAALAVLVAWAIQRPSPEVGLRILALLGIAVVAAIVRWHAPATLLHCNNHGVEDLRAVLGADLADQPRLILRYGPAFFGPQAWLGHALGGGDQAVFLVSVAVGSLATALAAAAAWTWTTGVWPGLIAGLFCAVLPLSARVGHSESNLVFGQVSIALMLLAAGMRVRLRQAEPAQEGVLAKAVGPASTALLGGATLLTATGHTFGPGYAVAVLVVVAESLAGRGRGVRDHARTIGWFVLPVLAFALLVGGADGSNRARLAAATLGEASPFKPLAYLLWFDPTWTPWPAQALVVFGIARFWRAGGLLRRAALLPGLGLLIGLALFIGGSVSVALRYQSLLAPVWALLAGAAFAVPPREPEPGRAAKASWPDKIGVVFASVLAVVGLAGAAMSASAWQFLDLEAQVYAALRPVVPTLPDGAVVLVPDREGAPDQEIVIDFPDFLAKTAGRRLSVLHLGEWQRLQRETVAAKAPAVYVWRSPHCQARARVVGRWPEGRDQGGLPLRAVCRPLVDLAARPGSAIVAQGRHPPPREDPDRLHEEYHQFAGTAVAWSLIRLGANP